jgi:hypothetical protein
MSDEQPVSSPDERVPSAISPEVEEKPRRKPRKPSEPKPQGLPTTEAGEKVADGLRRKLVEMVDAAALTEANRRRATAIDATDYEAGFDRIAGPAKLVTTVAIVADAAGAIGTGLTGYYINILDPIFRLRLSRPMTAVTRWWSRSSKKGFRRSIGSLKRKRAD